MELDPRYRTILGNAHFWKETLETQAAIAQESLNRLESSDEVEEEEVIKNFNLAHRMYGEAEKLTEPLADFDMGDVSVRDFRELEEYRITKAEFEEVNFEEFGPPEGDYSAAHNYCRNSAGEKVEVQQIVRKFQRSLQQYEELTRIAIEDYGLDIEPLREVEDVEGDAEILE